MATIYLDRDIYVCMCVSSILAYICFVLGLHGGFQECHLVHGPFYCKPDSVVLLFDCWTSVCGICQDVNIFLVTA